MWRRAARSALQVGARRGGAGAWAAGEHVAGRGGGVGALGAGPFDDRGHGQVRHLGGAGMSSPAHHVAGCTPTWSWSPHGSGTPAVGPASRHSFSLTRSPSAGAGAGRTSARHYAKGGGKQMKRKGATVIPQAPTNASMKAAVDKHMKALMEAITPVGTRNPPSFAPR